LGLRAGLGHRLQDHGGVRFRGVRVRRLDGEEVLADSEPLEQRRHAAARLARSDAEHHVGAARELADGLERAREHGLMMARVLAQLEEGLAVSVADPRHEARVGVLRQQARDSERQREPDDGEDLVPHRQLEAVRVEGARHRRHDDVLTVDQRAVAVEDDEVHVGVYRAEGAGELATRFPASLPKDERLVTHI